MTECESHIIDFNAVLHRPAACFWAQAERAHLMATRVLPDRYEQTVARLKEQHTAQGDALVARVKDVFHNGMGVKWSDEQITIFNAFLASCLPLIYGSTWPEEKTRVLKDWKMEREQMFSLVNMARRNGKTMVTSGTAAALILCIPHIKIAIFSTCKRTSQMMLSAIMDRLDQAFTQGTHVTRQDYIVVTRNLETVCFEGPDGTKRTLGSFPGSVRVSTRALSISLSLSLVPVGQLSVRRKEKS